MQKLLQIVKHGVWIFVVLSVFTLMYGFNFLHGEITFLKSKVRELETSETNPSITKVNEAAITSIDSGDYKCGAVCIDSIKTLVKEEFANITPIQEKVVVNSPEKTQTSYIPMGTAFSSTSTDWYTLPGSQSFIDLKNDFSEDSYVTWEASLKVAHGNGQAFARLWDDTNNIAVNNSEISTINNSDYKRVSSNRIYLWSGNNSYKVQVKSLNSFEVFYSNGKVKVVY